MNAASPPRRRAPAALALLVLLLPALALAGLYGPEAPADAAWLRVVNAGAPGGVAVRVGSDASQVLGFGQATRYVLVAPGSVRVDVGGEVLDVEVGPESFTTVAAVGDGARVIADPALRDVSRGLLGLLNLTDRAALDLVVPDGPVVVPAVPPGFHDAVTVAEATTELAVADGGALVARLEARTYARGAAHVVVVAETAEGLAAFVLTATAE